MSSVAQVIELALKIVQDINEKQWVQAFKRVGQYLGTVATMRVYIPNSPASGHQSNTVMIIRNVIGFGLQGKSGHASLEVVFENTTRTDEKSNLQKLMALMPEINQEKPFEIFYISGVGLQLIPQEQFAGAPLDFGFTGGQDKNDANLAKLLNVSYCLRLQPYQWTDGDNGIWLPENKFLKFSSGMSGLGIRNIVAQPYFAEFPVIGTKDWDLLESKFPQKVTAVKAILARLPNKIFTMLPVYGINEINNEIPTLKGVTQSQIVFNFVTGILAAQRVNAAPVNKGTLMIMLSTLTSTQKGILQGIFSLDGPEDDRYPKLNKYCSAFVRGKVEFLGFDDTDLGKKLDWLGTSAAKNHVFILELGPITQTFFQFFYQQCTLPSVFEGQGTMVFSTNVGKPFIKLNQTLYPLNTTYPSVQLQETFEEPPQVASQIVALSVTLTTFQMWEYFLTGRSNDESGFDLVEDVFKGTISGLNRLPSFLLSQFIIEGFRPDTRIATYFDLLGKFCHDMQNDKLLLTLAYTVLSYLQKKETLQTSAALV